MERGPDFQGDPVSMNVTIITIQKILPPQTTAQLASLAGNFFSAHAKFFLPFPLSQATLPRAYDLLIILYVIEYNPELVRTQRSCERVLRKLL